jgi:hypothetical protein
MSFDLVYFLERKSYKGFARGMRGINIGWHLWFYLHNLCKPKVLEW